MTPSRVDLAELPSQRVPAPVPYAAIVPARPEGQAPLPLCLFLHGGGADRDFLVAQQPFFDGLWQAGELPPLLLATASTGELSFYLDHPDGKTRWESFLLEDFLPHLRETYPVRSDPAGTLIAGASMGGYGALKIAFRKPELFAAVAALEPAIEPALRSEDSGPRNRFFYTPGAVDELLGPERDPALWADNNPANRAVENADAIRDSGLAIYLEVGDEDCFHLHDGAEFLHRVLWEQQIPHEYHLVRGADHVGPSLLPRLREAFVWLGARVEPEQGEAGDEPPLSDTARAWLAWMERGFEGAAPPPLDMSTREAVTVLRRQNAAAREQAAREDPTVGLRFGRLPPVGGATP